MPMLSMPVVAPSRARELKEEMDLVNQGQFDGRALTGARIESIIHIGRGMRMASRPHGRAN